MQDERNDSARSRQSLTGLIERLEQEAGGEKVGVKTILNAVGSRAIGSLLFLPALIAVSPLGGIPGVPTVLAVVIVLIALQGVFRKNGIWLPGFITRRKVSTEKLKAALDKCKPVARWIDKILSPHLQVLVSPPAPQIIAVLCTVLAITMPPLELVPMAVAAPASAILLLSIGLVSNDGRVVLGGLVTTCVAFALPIWLL